MKETKGRAPPTVRTTLDPLALRLSAFYPLLFVPSHAFAVVPLRVTACAMLLRGQWLRSPVGWWILTALMVQTAVVDWPVVEDHQILAGCWILTVALASATRLGIPEPKEAARVLVGSAFCFAVLWKLLPGEHLDGTFWEATLLTSSHLSYALSRLGDLPSSVVAANAAALEAFYDPSKMLTVVPLTSTTIVERLAVLLGWVGPTLETSLAILFMLPSRFTSETLRTSLVAGYLTFSLLLPVPGFVWVLVTITVAHLETEATFPRRVLVSFALIGIGLASLNSLAGAGQ